MDVECLERELIVRRDENNVGQLLLVQRLEHLEAGQFGHLDIKVNNNQADMLHITVALTGSLDSATSGSLETVVSEILEEPPKVLAFDLAGLTFLSSAGIRVLAVARKALTERGGTVAMLNMQPQIQKVFEIVKALPGFKVFNNTAEMDRYLAAMQTRVAPRTE